MKKHTYVNDDNIFLTLKNINFKSAKQHILNHISFNAHLNEKILLLGANGAGKSTLLKIISGLLAPTDGTIHIDDHRTTSLAAKKLRAYIPQYIDFPAKLKVLEIINFIKQHYRHSLSNDELQSLCDLDMNTYAFNLSGGQKRRLALTLALLGKPMILLLDEPESGLDVAFRESVLKELVLRAERSNLSMIMASHFFDSATQYFDRVIILKQGKILYDQSVSHFLSFKHHLLRYDIYADKPQELINSLIMPLRLRYVKIGEHLIRLYIDKNKHSINELQQKSWPGKQLQQQLLTTEDIYLYHQGAVE